MVDGLIKMMDSKQFGPINLGNPSEYTVKQLAELIIELTNSNSKIIYNPLPENDPKKRKPDISLAKEKLNWEPKVSVIEGLQKTIEYFKNIQTI